MNKRIRKKKQKQENQFIKCDGCGNFTEYYREEDQGNLCPSCWGKLVGLSLEEVYRSL